MIIKEVNRFTEKSDLSPVIHWYFSSKIGIGDAIEISEIPETFYHGIPAPDRVKKELWSHGCNVGVRSRQGSPPRYVITKIG